MERKCLVVMLAGLVFSFSACSSCSVDTGKPSGEVPRALPEKTSEQTGRLNRFPLSSEKNMKLAIKTGKGEMTAILYDNAAAMDFFALLPMTVMFEDYNGTEKIARLPERLSTAGLPAGYAPSEGDLAYYAPWGNICIFYRDFVYSAGLVPLGRIGGDGIGKFRVPGSITVTIDRKK